MNIKLKDRIEAYSKVSDYRLLNKLPVVMVINGRSSNKTTALLDKPFSNKFAQCMYSSIVKLVQEIDGVVFVYSFNDEIVIISRNDQSTETQPWCNNKVQKISSIISSITTLQFNNYAASIDLELMEDVVFYSNVFIVPNITEAINTIVSKQQEAIQSAVYFACFYELLKRYDKADIEYMLTGTTIDDKINLLKQECDIDFNDYPAAFRRGVACYRVPKVVEFGGEEVIKNKFSLDIDLPIFTHELGFLKSIFYGGSDILRHDNI